jgi:hypothetical protein
MTERVCLGRGPVRLTAETPRSLLLSVFHNVGEVENRATGEIHAHGDEGFDNAGAAPVGVVASAGRTIRYVRMTVMPGSALMVAALRAVSKVAADMHDDGR